MTDDAPERRCSRCEATAPADSTHCPSCGAALAQRADLGGILVPGVTAVDPGLADLAGRPMRIPGTSPSQGMAPALIIGAAVGGPLGLAALGGVPAVAGVEYLGARRPGPTAPDGLESVGRPSEIARQVADRLDRGDPADDSADRRGDPAWPDVDGSPSNSDNSTRD